MNSNDWINVKDRRPTRQDADNSGKVLGYADVFGVIIDHWEHPYSTHWMPLPPRPESSAEKLARLDEEAYVEWTKTPYAGHAKDAWTNALRYARGEKL